MDTVNAVSHFRVFVDELYKVYSMSPKSQRELECVASSLSVELMKVQRIFDVRWVFSSFVSVKAILRNYCTLFTHFVQCASPEHDRSCKDRSSGLAKKLQSWYFVSETCMLKDALRCLKQLSLYLQSNEASVVDSASHVDDTKTKLLALKEGNGRAMAKFSASFASDGHYKGIAIIKKEGDEVQFQNLRGQFMQSLHDNIEQRFSNTDFLSAVSCLSKAMWPQDPLRRALYGEKEIALLCKDLG